MQPLAAMTHLVQRGLFSPFLVQLVVTRRCNLSCSYCNEFDRGSSPVPLEVLRGRLERIKALGAWAVELTGGEPMLHPHIVEVVAHARQLQFAKVMMISNAFLLGSEQIRRLNEAGLQELQVSVDGVRPTDETRKVLDILRPKLEVLAREAKFRVVLSAVLGSAPLAEVLEVIAFAKACRFTPRFLVLHDGGGQMKLASGQLADYQQVMAALGRRSREANDYRRQILETGEAPFRCRAGSRYLYIDEEGGVCWCSQTRDRFRIPLEAYGFGQLKEQFYTAKRCAPSCTVGCARTCSAYDGWRQQRRRATRS